MTLRRRIVVSIPLWFILVVIVGGRHPVQADVETLSFSIGPAVTTGSSAESTSYFLHIASAGTQLSDQAIVHNKSAVPLELLLYATDGVTAVNGGTTFAHKQLERSMAGAWLTLAVDRIQLGPGEAESVAFTLDIPAGTPPGVPPRS